MRLWCGVMLTACWSGAAVAQTSPLRNLDIFVGNVLTYDDNVFRLPDGVTRPGVSKRSDWIIEPTVSVSYTRPLARGQLMASGRLSYRFYGRNSELNRENVDLNLRGDTALWRCTVTPNVSFRRQQSDLADIIDGVTVKNADTRLRFGSGLLCGNDVGIRPGVEYSYENVSNSSSAREISDYHRHTVTGRLGYSRPSLGLIALYGTLQQGKYPNRPLIGSVAANDEVRTYSGGLEYSRELGTRLSGSVYVGYMKVKAQPSTIPSVAGVPGHSGITYGGDLSYRGSDRISASLSFSRDTQQSNLLGIDYSLQTQFAGSINYAVSRIISLSGTASHTRRSFRGTAFVVPGVVLGSGDRTTQFGGAITFQSFRRLNFKLSGTHFIRSSPLPNLDYTGTQIALTTGLQF